MIAGFALSLAGGGLMIMRSGTNAPYAVNTTVATRGDIQTYVVASGNVISGDELSLASPLAGRITAVTVKEGERCVAGQTLVRFDTRELRARIDERQAALNAALATQASLERDSKALSQLYAIGGESKKSVAGAELAASMARRDTAAIRFELQRLRVELERYDLKAPSRSRHGPLPQ